MSILSTITSEGFTSTIQWDGGRMFFVADMDVDADGANGQNGKQAAYMLGNLGSEDLANGGMGIRNGKIVGIKSWFTDIVLVGKDGNPLVLPSGVIPSKTSYKIAGKSPSDPLAYLDSETVPYIAVPPICINGVAGVVMGCKVRCTNKENGRSQIGIVGDRGPAGKIGEGSIAMARGLGLNPNPRSGGTEKPIIIYEIWPDVTVSINGTTYALQKS